jgi:predicted phosphodiesterase
MIYITGDCHADFRKLNLNNFPEQKSLTKDDFVVICGDFGLVWNAGGENDFERYWLKWFEDRTFTVLFIDGNHENFDRLSGYPEKEWHGGRVHVIRPSVMHLMRGQIFELDGKRLFTFGGAQSHDIDGGILDPNDDNFKKRKKQLDKDWTSYRIRNVSWWEAELPTADEMNEGISNLSRYGMGVDYMITHCAPSSIQKMFDTDSHLYRPDIETDYLDSLKTGCDFKRWYFGHYHQDRDVNEQYTVLDSRVIRIGDMVGRAQ